MLLVRNAIFAIAVAYVLLCAVMFFFQRSLLYFPQTRSGDYGATVLTLPKDVLALARRNEGAKALVYFGGNSEDVSVNMPGLVSEFPDRAIYLLHYRGFGGSAGSPSQEALFEDGLELFDRVHARHSEVLVVGRSLGSAVALYVATRRPVSRLVLITPFDSVQSLAAHHYPFVPVRWLLRDKFESWKFAPEVTAPTLIIAAADDEVVPRASTELLFSRFKNGVAVLKVLRGRHNTVSESAEYAALLPQW